MRRRQRKKQRKIIILTSITLLFIMTVGYAAFNTNLNISVKGNIKEKSRVLKKYEYLSTEDFQEEIYKNNIVSISFLDNQKVPDNSTKSWDVSEKQDGGVLAWIVSSNEDNTKYDLYIGANKGVIANEDSSWLFHNFQNVKSINFNDNYDTSNTLSIRSMFANCMSLTTLDVSSWNTNKVTTTRELFYGCKTLQEIKGLERFNTQNVTTMRGMFGLCNNLTSINVSSFDTSNVTDMDFMFEECQNITELNLCNFNTNKVSTIMYMFARDTNLKNIYVGPNWTTTNADTTNMFNGCTISQVTTGQC